MLANVMHLMKRLERPQDVSYESHITIELKDAIPWGIAVAQAQKWKTSQIDGDPLLGDKVYFYLTAHDSDYHRLFDRMKETVEALESNNVVVLREKIEHIIYDTKGKIVHA